LRRKRGKGRENMKEGYLRKNDVGRYELATGYYFTSGEPIEVFVDGKWHKTRIEHNGRDYYAVGFEGMKLDGVRARG
jgi:hypothetical protein